MYSQNLHKWRQELKQSGKLIYAVALDYPKEWEPHEADKSYPIPIMRSHKNASMDDQLNQNPPLDYCVSDLDCIPSRDWNQKEDVN